MLVLDPRWPARLRADAERDLAAASDADRTGPGDLVVFTSGSSGRPRGVVRTVASWTASVEALTAVTGIGPSDVVWLPGPLSSSLTLYGAFHAGYVGACAVLGPPRPDVTCAHLVPAALADACDAADRGALAELRTVVVAGAAPLDRLRERARGHGWRVVEYYGAAELSFVGWRADAGPMRDFPGARVRVVDDLLWVSSPYLARGYLRADDDGPLRRGGAWASVGDHGRTEPGGWQVVGRGDLAITTGGHTVLAEEVERALGSVHGVHEVAVTGLAHPRLGQLVAAIVVPVPGAEPAALRTALVAAARSLPAPARPRRWLACDALPRTASGKVDRAAVAVLAPGRPPLR